MSRPHKDIGSHHIGWAKAYPFDVPETSYLFAEGRALPLAEFRLADPANARVESAGLALAICHVLPRNQVRMLAETPRHAVLACGSNAAPSRLRQKFGHRLADTIIPVLRVKVRHLSIVHAANITSYGSIPATFFRLADAEVDTFVTLLSDAELAVMDETETLGIAYDRPSFATQDVTLETGEQLAAVCGYVNRHGALMVDGAPVALKSVRSGNVPFVHYAQAEVLARTKKVLGHEGPVDHYIAQNIADERLRRARAAELRDRHSIPFDGFDRLISAAK